MPVLDANEIMFTAFEPKVQNRFIMYIDGIPSYLIKSATAPGFEAGEIILDHINVYRKVKGKVRWNDMTLSLYSCNSIWRTSGNGMGSFSTRISNWPRWLF